MFYWTRDERAIGARSRRQAAPAQYSRSITLHFLRLRTRDQEARALESKDEIIDISRIEQCGRNK